MIISISYLYKKVCLVCGFTKCVVVFFVVDVHVL